MDSRTPEERANEPESVTTSASALPTHQVKEFPQGKEAYCPRCYFENEKVVLRTECPHQVKEEKPSYVSAGKCHCGDNKRFGVHGHHCHATYDASTPTSLISAIKKWAEEKKRKMGNHNYDGNNLRSAEDYYSISAESWSEVIRLEDGMNRIITDLLTYLNSLEEEKVDK